MKKYLAQVIAGKNLTKAQAQECMDIIMAGQATEAQIGGFLTALRIKGETGEEIAGFAKSMRSHARKLNLRRTKVLDTCGTGGDCAKTFNISTAAAFVLAGAGVAVAKHGNHGVSSMCGSADVLSGLGIDVNLPIEAVERAVDELGVGFLYAPLYHQAMKHAAKPRRELGFRTVFNLLGPLTNPAAASFQVLGVYERSLTFKLAEALVDLGVERAMVVHSLDGLDEISSVSPTQVAEVNRGQISYYVINPSDYGLGKGSLADYQGESPAQNAAALRRILEGEKGAKRDVVLLNAAAGLYVAGKAADLQEGLKLAAHSIDSGAALRKLEDLRDFSRRYREGLLSS